MTTTKRLQKQVSSSLVWTAAVLLLGIVVLGSGYYSGNRIALYTGLLITLGGVLSGVMRLIVNPGPRDSSRS